MGVKDLAVARGQDGAGVRAAVSRVLDRLSIWDEAVRSRWPFSALVGADISPDTTGDGSHVLVRPAILGFIAICAITAGVAQGQSPFTLKAPGAWFFGVPTPTTTAHAPHASPGLFFGLVAVYGGLVLLMRVWYGLILSLIHI